MKILQVLNNFYPEGGGVENLVLQLSRALIRRGCMVEVLSGTAPEPRALDLPPALRVTNVGHAAAVAHGYISPQLIAALLRADADVIHTHIPHPWSADWATYVGRLRRKPVVLTYHNDMYGKGIYGRICDSYNRTVLPATLAACAAIVTTTRAQAAFSKPLRRFRDKMTTIPHGVDDERFRPIRALPGDGTLGFLAMLRRNHEYKGLPGLLQAVHLLNERGVRVRLRVGGAGELLPAYRARCRALGIERQVEFLGYIPDDDLPAFYNSLDLFVLPSVLRKQEGFGAVALEAMACGRPVLVTDAAGVAEVVRDNATGAVVKAGDSHALAGAIARVLPERRALEEAGLRGRQYAESASWAASAEKHEALYRHLLSASATI